MKRQTQTPEQVERVLEQALELHDRSVTQLLRTSQAHQRAGNQIAQQLAELRQARETR